ncbi:tripartite tricarboxylate transporter TctB family protein [Streptosporangium nondiastaticum]|uniref:tripartite tricarboxylate transporter TctB family protein n=1 Tax=Streptosporangium TaxID=2000 RepID=UPI0031F7D812
MSEQEPVHGHGASREGDRTSVRADERRSPGELPSPDERTSLGDGPRSGDRAQYGVCAFLALLGALVIVDALSITPLTGSNDLIGPRSVPVILGVALLVVAVVYGVDVARGGRGEPEAGEDVDLSTAMDWRTVLLLAGAFAANAVLIEPLGWVISGTVMFWGAAFALGNRHHVRGLMIAVVLSLVTFYVFAIGLGVNLPAGVLQGIL